MASDKPSPVLLDAVKAQASKLRETKNALDARGKELDKLRAELDTRTAALENQAARLKAERDDFAQERDQVVAARSSMDKDIAGMRMERDKASAEERRVQDWARTLNDREKSIKDREDQVKRLEHELTDHLKESEGKIQALVEREELSAQRERALAETIDRLSVMERGMAERDRKLAKREEELIKLQNERLNALEAREREMLKISEEMYARQKESAAQHDSFVELQTTLKDELYHLASEREKLAVKEKSLLEAEKYITAALEASGIEMPEEPETKAPPPRRRRAWPATSSGPSRRSRCLGSPLATSAVRHAQDRHRVRRHPRYAQLVLLSRDFSPGIWFGDGAFDERPYDVRHEDELTDPEDERPDRLEPIQRPHGGRVIVHAARHTLEAEEVHREEHEVHADQGEGEVPAGEAFGVHPTRHAREPEVEAREDAEDRPAEEDVVQVGDDPVRVLKRIVERDRRLEHAVDSADDEHRHKADREEHRSLEFDRPAPHRRDPVEDLDAARHRDRQGNDHEREAGGDRDAGSEHVMEPHAERKETDRDGRQGDALVAEDWLMAHPRDDLRDDPHRRKDHDVYRRMGVEPEQVLPHDRVAADGGREERGDAVAVQEEDEQPTREDRRRQEDEPLRDEDRPDEQGEILERDPGSAVSQNRHEEVDRARGRRNPEELQPDDPHVDARAPVVHAQRRIAGPPDVRGAEPHDHARDRNHPETQRVDPRERHVLRADERRDHQVPEAREDRDRNEENHRGPVHCEQFGIRVRVDDRRSWVGELRPHQQGEDAADDEKQERVREVQDSDLVVVRRGEPTEHSDRCVPMTVCGDDLARHPLRLRGGGPSRWAAASRTPESGIRLSTASVRGCPPREVVSSHHKTFRGKRASPGDVGPPTDRPGGLGARPVRRVPRGKRSSRGYLDRSARDGPTLLSRPGAGNRDRHLGHGPRGLRGPEVPGAQGPHGGTDEPADEQPPPRDTMDHHPGDHPGGRRSRGVPDAHHDRHDPAESGCDHRDQCAPVVLELQHHVHQGRDVAQQHRQFHFAQHDGRVHREGWTDGQAHPPVV